MKQPKESIVLPNLLLNPVYVSGLEQPLLSVAEVLDNQGVNPETALALRNAAIICTTFSKINLTKEAFLFGHEDLNKDEIIDALEWATQNIGKHTRPSPIDKLIAKLKA